MATRTKTTRWAFPTRLTDVATNTTLAGATRHEFGAKTIYIPEGTRTVKSAFVRFTSQDANTAGALDIDAVRYGSNVQAAGWTDVDTTFDATDTAESETLRGQLDITANVVANMGAGASFTLDLAIAVATEAASNVRNITAELFLTYEYDDAAATHIKTVVIPMQSGETDLGTVYSEPGAAGTGPAPANQIPQLTGAGTPFLPEASVTIRDQYIIIVASDYGSPAATDFNMFVRLDGATELTRATIEGAQQSSRFYQDIIDSSLMPSTTAVHAFEMRSSLADRFFAPGGFLVVSYEFDPSSTTEVLNSIMVGARNERSTLNTDNADTSAPDRYTVDIDVQEPATVAMVQSAIYALGNFAGSGVDHYVTPTGQTARTYNTVAAQILEAMVPVVQRVDHSSSTWALSRGRNKLRFDFSIENAPAQRPATFVAILNYTSGKASAGVGAHNHTTWWFQKAFEGTATAGATVTPTAPSIPEGIYKVGSVVANVMIRKNAPDVFVSASREAGEDAAAGWYNNGEMTAWSSSSESGTKEGFLDVTEWFRSNSFTTEGANVETARDWRYATRTSGGVASFLSALALTYHAISYAVAGDVTGSAGGTVDLAAHRSDTGEIVATTSRVGNGAYSMSVFDDTVAHYVTAREDATHVGRSDNATPA